MHPLLVSAAANAAGNFLDRWSRGPGPAPVANGPGFEKALDRASGVAKPAATPETNALTLAARLRQQLLDSPEVRSILDSSDPSKPPTIEVAPDGKVLAASPGRDPKALLLSPETAELARSITALQNAPASISSTFALKLATTLR
jgi:hypothetical protein